MRLLCRLNFIQIPQRRTTTTLACVNTKLLPLKASQLRDLAIALGANTAGTKKVVAESILSTLQSRQAIQPSESDSLRILSIDMGIRNLAICVLKVPIKHTPSGMQVHLSPPELVAWKRQSLTKGSEERSETIDPDFTMPVYSTLANNLVRTLLHDYGPIDVVLIEEQRWRSGNGIAIQQWTVKVNTFASMLHAVLDSLRLEGLWSGIVESVSPRKVAGYWVPKVTEEAIKLRTAPAVKAAKITAVKTLVQEGLLKGLQNELVNGASCLFFVDGKSRTRLRGPKSKLDDLADSLLQGLTWVRWEAHRDKVLTGEVPGDLPDATKASVKFRNL